MRCVVLERVLLAAFALVAATGCPSGKSADDTPPPASITTGSPLSSGMVGRAYSTSFSLFGGTAPLTWTLASGSLPPGLTLSAAGVVSGTPTTFVSAASPSSFTVKVVDGAGGQISKAFTMSVAAGSPQVLDASPVIVADNAATVLARMGGVAFDDGGTVTPASNPQFAVAWDDTTNGAANRDIFRQAYSPAAVPAAAAPSLVIAGGEAGSQSVPGLAFDRVNDLFLVAWAHDDGAGLRDIRGVRLNESYTVLGASFNISTTANPAADVPVAVAHSPNSQVWLVVWQDNLATDVIFARTVTSGGVAGAADIAVSDAPAGSGENQAPAVAWDSVNDQFLVLWTQFNAAASQSAIRGRFVSTTGAALGTGSFAVSATSAAVRLSPAVTFNPVSQRYVAAWTEQATTTSSRADVAGRGIQSSGALDAAFAIPNAANSRETLPAVQSGASGLTLLAWTTNRAAGTTGLDLQMALIDLAGNVGSEASLFTGIDQNTLFDQAELRLAYDTANARWLCAFGSFNSYTTPTTSKVKFIRVSP